jgi:hypothetical protein
MPKYDSRFENFFLNLRLNRAEYEDMARYTLTALTKANEKGKYDPLLALLEPAITRYAEHRRRTEGGDGLAATGSIGTVRQQYKDYLKRVERQHIIPNFDAGSPDIRALLPQGRAALANSPQDEVLGDFDNFLDAAAARPAAFPAAVLTEGRTLRQQLAAALTHRDGLTQQTDEHRAGVSAERQEVAAALLLAYATLLAEHHRQPERAATFFDFSDALVSKSSGAKDKPAAG